MKLSSIRASQLDNGQWVDIPGFPGVSVSIYPTDHVDYRRGIQAAMQPHARTIRAGRMIDPGVQDKMVARAVAKHLLRDWKGIDDDELGPDGKALPVPFSRDQALEWAEDVEYTRFFRAIEREGDILASLSAEEIEGLGKS
jgi:hypothetical protein